MIEKVDRPWGWYENLQEENGYKVKRLYIKSNEKISLQYHNHRNEHWVVVFGSGIVELGDIVREIKVGDYIFVPSNSKHRVSGGNGGIMIIEIQLGKICDEEDIVRIQDDYGRI
jgi:mannose-6-phosphate isomerase-like protein (cupin superfamily)